MHPSDEGGEYNRFNIIGVLNDFHIETLHGKIHPVVFSLIDNKQIKTYKLEPGGKELIETDAGQFNTLKFSYYDEIKERKVIIWCAKKLGYLPIQIKRIDSDGDYGELKIISLKPGEVTDLNTNDSENDNDF